MNVQQRTSNVQRRMMNSVIIKKIERSDSILRHSIFVIRYSAVRFSKMKSFIRDVSEHRFLNRELQLG